jgi:PAS domain S-box-containing protein
MTHSLDKSVLAALGLAVAMLLGSATLTDHNTRRLGDDFAWVAHTYEVETLIADLLGILVDAETGERGFILTGTDEFLQPYDQTLRRLEGQMSTLQEKTKDNPRQQENIQRLQAMVVLGLALLKEGIDLRRKSEPEAKAFIATGKGKAQMDAIRSLAAEMHQEEQDLLFERERRSHTAYTVALTTNFLTAALGVFMVVMLYRLLLRNLIIRHTAEAVREQKEWLRTTLSSIGDAVIATDTDARVTFLNGAAQALTGRSENDAIGQPLDTVFHIVNEQSRLTVENPARQALRNGVIVGLANHTVLIATDGTERPIDDSAAPIRDGQGNVFGAVLVFRDVTKRKQAQKIAERQGKLLDLAHDGIFVRDLDGRVTYWNQGAAAMYGWEKVQALGHVTHQLLHTEFPVPLKDIEEQLLQVGQWEGELVHTRQDGSQIVVASRWGLQRDMHGKPHATLEINRDITQRKRDEEALHRAHGELEQRVLERTAELAQVNESLHEQVAFRARAEEELRRQTEALRKSEAEFHQLVDSIPQLATMAQPDGHVLWFNKRWYDYTGKTAEQMEGWGWQTVHDQDELPEVLESWKASLASGEAFDRVVRLRGIDGQFRSFLTRCVPLRGSDGQIVRWFGTNTDISEQMQLEEELRRTQVELEERVRDRTAAAEARARALGKSEEALREQTQLIESILNSMGEGVVVADVDGRFILFNPAADVILGVGLTQSSPDSWSDVYGLFYPDAKTPFPAEELPLARAMRGEVTDDCELYVRNAVQSSGRLITAAGRPILTEAGTLRGGVAVFRDITARKLVEEQIKASLLIGDNYLSP